MNPYRADKCVLMVQCGKVWRTERLSTRARIWVRSEKFLLCLSAVGTAVAGKVSPRGKESCRRLKQRNPKPNYHSFLFLILVAIPVVTMGLETEER